MFSVVVFYGIIAYVFLDVRFLVMIVFLIAIAACEISVGLMLC
jgi:NADH:ubiquinone oxidoreductase subunit K